MRFLALLLLFIATTCARAQVLYISPRLGGWNETNGFPAYHIVSCEQLPNHTMEAQWTQDPIELAMGGVDSPANWEFIAGYGCWFEDQFDIATIPNRSYPWSPPYAWVRSINRPCVFGFAPEPVTFNYFPNLSPQEKAWRGYYKGKLMKIGVEVLPGYPNGVRRFLGVPADE